MQVRILISGSDVSRATYETAVCVAGAVPLSHYCPSPALPFDGLVLAGGGDVDAALFGQTSLGSLPPDRKRDQVELALVDRCLREELPILGICRGHQLLHIALGGDLIQDLPADISVFHRPPSGTETDMHHPIRTHPTSLLYDLYGALPSVNSFHHQAVAHLGKGFTGTAWSESGLLEAAEHRRLPIVTVQFHPERGGTAADAQLFQWLTACCRDRKTKGGQQDAF